MRRDLGEGFLREIPCPYLWAMPLPVANNISKFLLGPPSEGPGEGPSESSLKDIPCTYLWAMPLPVADNISKFLLGPPSEGPGEGPAESSLRDILCTSLWAMPAAAGADPQKACFWEIGAFKF